MSTLDDLRPGPLRAIALLLLAGVRIYDNGFADALKYLREALDNAAGNAFLQIQALILLSFTQGFSFMWDESLATAKRAVAMAEEHGTASQLSQALANQVFLTFTCMESAWTRAGMRRALELEDLNDRCVDPVSGQRHQCTAAGVLGSTR